MKDLYMLIYSHYNKCPLCAAQKLQVFLFEHILVLTRPATRGSQLRYQVYRQPIPASQLLVEDLTDGQEKRGSFKTAFSNNTTSRL